MDILNKTLSEMNFTFSSNEFSKKAQKNGLSQMEVDNGVIALFLHRNALQLGTKRMWIKKNVVSSDKQKSDEITIAIDLLKSKGYKISKPVTEWVEL